MKTADQLFNVQRPYCNEYAKGRWLITLMISDECTIAEFRFPQSWATVDDFGNLIAVERFH